MIRCLEHYFASNRGSVPTWAIDSFQLWLKHCVGIALIPERELLNDDQRRDLEQQNEGKIVHEEGQDFSGAKTIKLFLP